MRACILLIAFACFVSFSHGKSPKSIAETLSEDGRFTTLLTAIGEADLLDNLIAADAVTILAPTDEAFNLLPDGTVSSLLLPENQQQLTNILSYHVIGAALNAETITGLSSGQTLTGQRISIVADGSKLLINDAKVVSQDIAIPNGVVHVIDRVLLPPSEPEIADMVAFLANDGRFTTLVAAANAAGLLDSSASAGFPILPQSLGLDASARPQGLFAPTDEAFAKLPAGTVDSLLLPENNALLQQVLLYHFIPFDGRSSAISRLTQVPTVIGQELNVVMSAGGLGVNNASIIEPDQTTGSGTIHVVDTVLIPSSDPETRTLTEMLQADGRFTSLIAALDAAGIVDTLVNSDRLTLLAPTDAAFDQFTGGDPTTLAELLNSEALADALSGHVLGTNAPAEVVRTLTSAEALSGDTLHIVATPDRLFVNDALVIDADIRTSEGFIIHATDRVITPSASGSEMAIPAVAAADGRFTTLLAAVEAAGLVDVLNGPGPFTLFAPIDEAFASLPVEFLLLPENRDLLTSILTYHVVPQKISASMLARTTTVATVQGETLNVQSDGSMVSLDGTSVLVADVMAGNGVVHAIGEVLVPPSVRDRVKLLGIAANDGRFSTLLAAAEAAGLSETLKGEGPFTLLAPTDEAFAQLPEGTLENLLLPENQDTLREILLNHVIEGRVDSATTLALKRAEPLSCKPLSIYVDDRDHSLYINGSKVIQTDISASNGLLHVIDTVLLPSEVPTRSLVEIAAGDERFTTLVTALTAANLIDTVNESEALTVFAPTNDAFDSLPEGLLDSLLEPANQDQLRTVLLYHVLDSEGRSSVLTRLPQAPSLAGQRLNLLPSADGLAINNAKVLIPDILATNGVIHAVDTVLLPSLDPEPRNLAQVLAGDGRFKTLLAAVEAAGLSDTVVNSPALTILAPTDEAFAALPEGTLATLLLPENQQQLADLVLYHVIAGDVRSEAVLTLTQAETVAGPRVNIVREGDLLFLNQAQVLQTDLPASNGVIHILDAVISPPSTRSPESLVSIASQAGTFDTLLTAVGLAGLGELLGSEGPFTILAPTDDAFAQLDPSLLASLLEPENVDQLRDILLYHVFTEEIGSGTLSRLTHPFAASGAGIAVSASDGGLQVNGISIATADLYGSNGVIHVIDEVLIPSAPSFELTRAEFNKGSFLLEWLANRSGPYTLQSSDNLQTWQDILTTDAKQAEVVVEGGDQYFRVVR